ncbi:unnamed protein product, partial [Tilletia controversa]
MPHAASAATSTFPAFIEQDLVIPSPPWTGNVIGPRGRSIQGRGAAHAPKSDEPLTTTTAISVMEKLITVLLVDFEHDVRKDNLRQQLRRFIDYLGPHGVLPNVRGERSTISYEDMQKMLLYTMDPRVQNRGGWLMRVTQTIFILAMFTMGLRIGDLVPTHHDDCAWRWGDVELWLTGWNNLGPVFEMWVTWWERKGHQGDATKTTRAFVPTLTTAGREYEDLSLLLVVLG